MAGSGAVPTRAWGQRRGGAEHLPRDTRAGCTPHRPERTRWLRAARTGAAWVGLGDTEVRCTTPGAWLERWMEGSWGLRTGSGLVACARAGGERGRCREQTWAWSRPGWRRAEDGGSAPGM